MNQSDQLTNLVRYAQLSQGERLTVITAMVMIFLYILIAVWTLVNVKRYLIDQKRYKTFSVLVFYVLALVIELSRMLMYANVIVMSFWYG